MATIPIEITIQDQASPITPTPSTNTETNMTVPDTSGSGSNIFTGSASAIVLPAILLILALGTIVGILIHKYNRQKHTKNETKVSKKEKLVASASTTIAVLAATVLVGILVIPATKAATSDVVDGITPAEDKISVVVTRDGGSAEASTESTATIASSSDFGYKVLLSIAEGVETSNLYLNGDTSSEHYISSTESTELGNNTWGYALTEDGEYSAVPLPANAATVAQGNEPVEDEGLSIYYGVKVSSDLPAGTYSGGEVEFSLVALEPTIDTLTYMQDFAKLSESGKASVLRSMTEGEQYALKDSRDTKDYFISKLADGNVWMTQNLDLDLDENTELTPADTNIPSNWTPINSTCPSSVDLRSCWKNAFNVPGSYDPGDVYFYTSGTTEDDIQYNSLVECEAAGHTECQHYHVGNYYNWPASIANNDSSDFIDQYDNSSASICPAGWRLPIGPSNENVSGGDMIATLIDYGNILKDKTTTEDLETIYPYQPQGFILSRKNPLWLVRAGSVDWGQMKDLGVNSGYWSSTNGSNTSAYLLGFYSDSIRPVVFGSKRAYYSIRCLVR